MSFDTSSSNTTISIESLINEISSDMLIMQNWVPNPMDIDNFLNPVDELVQDSVEAIDDVVLSEFLREVDEDEIVVEHPRVSHSEAIEALKTLRLYEEQQEQGETQLIGALHKHERLIEARKIGGQKQSDIRSFFGA
jgi:hypothetical protein